MKRKLLFAICIIALPLCIWIMASCARWNNVRMLNNNVRMFVRGNCKVTAIYHREISSMPRVTLWCDGMQNSQMGKPTIILSCLTLLEQGLIHRELTVSTGISQEWPSGSKIPVIYHFTDSGTFEDVGMIQDEMWVWDQYDQTAMTDSSFPFNLFSDNIKPGRKVLFKLGDRQAVIEFDEDIANLGIQPWEICTANPVRL